MATVAEIKLEQAALNAANAGKVDADGNEYVPLAVDGDVGPLTRAARGFTPVISADPVAPAGGSFPPAGVPDPRIAELQGQLDASIANANTLKATTNTLRTTLSEANQKLFDKTALLESDIKGSKAIIADTLALYGLPASLATTLNNALVGGESGTAIAMQIRETPEYAARFPAMAQRRELNLPAVSEADYLNLE